MIGCAAGQLSGGPTAIWSLFRSLSISRSILFFLVVYSFGWSYFSWTNIFAKTPACTVSTVYTQACTHITCTTAKSHIDNRPTLQNETCCVGERVLKEIFSKDLIEPVVIMLLNVIIKTYRLLEQCLVSNNLAQDEVLHPSVAFAFVGSSLYSLYWLPQVQNISICML